ncbi:MAG: sulfurtransferase-like selenium metabolism protein YedF [Lachnospiraceae bacterium]
MITVNAIGDNCPVPVIKTKKAMQSLTGPGAIEVFVDNEIAVANVTKMATSSGGTVTSEKISDQEYKVVIQMLSVPIQDAETCEDGEQMNRNQMVVAIASDRMGEGNDELGKVLIKGFIYAVTQLEILPKAILFYNGGATLTAEGSDSLEDLKGLEEQGVEILTCGTCLDYYHLKDKLQVGSVTNMYSIVETMASASNILRP